MTVALKTAPLPTVRRRRSRVSCREYAVTIASRFYFSQFYQPIYLFTVAASVLLAAWTAWNQWRIPTSLGFVALEIAVSAFLVFEVLLRMLAFRQRFWSKWWNLIDFFALAMSLLSVYMYYNEEGVLQELEEVFADAVVVLRNVLQYMRLAIFLKNRQERVGSAEETEIDFDQLAFADEEYAFDDDEIDEEQGLVVARSPTASTLDRRDTDSTDDDENSNDARLGAVNETTTTSKYAVVDLAHFG